MHAKLTEYINIIIILKKEKKKPTLLVPEFLVWVTRVHLLPGGDLGPRRLAA